MTTADRAVAIDLGALGVVGIAVCVASHHLLFMTTLVIAVLLVRTALACTRGGRSARVEVPFVLLCALLGGGNDWNTVVRHGVYAYAVPTDLPALSTIPTWMLLYWGIILRAIATLATYERLGDARLAPGATARPSVRVVAQLAIVLATRQAIYRLWGDALWSWLPFAIGLVVYLVALRPPQRARRLALVALVVGPPVEMAFIHLGGLHRYSLGWLGGVPLWIALWWALGVLVWSDLAPRIEVAIAGRWRNRLPTGTVSRACGDRPRASRAPAARS
jgi:hypothetical protein